MRCRRLFLQRKAQGAQQSSVRELSAGRLTCLVPRSHRNARACSFAARLTRSSAIRRQETRSGQGALARRHTDGPLRAALLKTTLRCDGLDPIATFCSDSFRCSKSSDCSWVLKLGPWYLVPILPVTVLRVKPIAGEYSREHCPRVYAICRPELG